MSSNVEKIKEKLDAVSLISSYIKLEKAGANFKAKCPFHNEKTPSFIVSPDRGTFYCFGCGAKGDIFSFVEQFEGLDFKGALKTLAEKAGVTLEKENPKAKGEKDNLYSAMEYATLFFQKKLGLSAPAMDYLRKRGIKKETVMSWRLGFAPDDWRELYDFLKSKGFGDKDIIGAGLAKKNETGREPYDTFRGRIIFPIFDVSGRVVAFSGRILVADDKAPKYLNSPETPLWSKSDTLYGLNSARVEIRKRDFSVVVEGQMDLIMSHQAGVKNAVATSGTALTAKHLERLKRISGKIIFAFDSDTAGISASDKATKLAMELGLDVKIARCLDGKDPADLILKDPKLWKEALVSAKHVIDFHTDILTESVSDKRKLGKEVEKKILPYIALIDSAIERAHYISKISKFAGVREDALWEEAKKILGKKGRTANSSEEQKEKPVKNSDYPRAREVVGIILWQRNLKNPFLDSELLYKKICEIAGEERCKVLSGKVTEEGDSVIFELEEKYKTVENLSLAIPELLLNFEEEHLLYEQEKILSEMENEEGLENHLMKRGREISIRIDKIKNERGKKT